MTIATSSSEVDELLTWLRGELMHTQYGKVGLMFTLHQGRIVAVERTISVKARFELKGENGGD